MHWLVGLAIIVLLAATLGVLTRVGSDAVDAAPTPAPPVARITADRFLKHYYDTLDLAYRKRKFCHRAQEACIERVIQGFERVHERVPALADELTSMGTTLRLLWARARDCFDDGQRAQALVREAMQRHLDLPGLLNSLDANIDGLLRQIVEQEVHERWARLEAALRDAGVAAPQIAAARASFQDTLMHAGSLATKHVTHATVATAQQRMATAATAGVIAGVAVSSVSRLPWLGLRFGWLSGGLAGIVAGAVSLILDRADCRAAIQHEIVLMLDNIEQQSKDLTCDRVREVAQALFERLRHADTQAATIALAR